MTPAARLCAAMDILDRVLAGTPAEQALTNWARASRFAGSADRHGVRDLVFDALRCRRSFAALGGADTGRGLMLGLLRAGGQDPAALFTGEGHAPPPVLPHETGRQPMGEAEEYDLPGWQLPLFQRSLGADFAANMELMRRRAPVFVRVNAARITRERAIAALAQDDIGAVPHPLADTALEITRNARRLHLSKPYMDGLVELQDAASQAVIGDLPLAKGMKVLDYCAGGGGKALAMAGQARLDLFVHDANAQRMRDVPARAKRAGTSLTCLQTPELPHHAPFDLVLCDVPCSGSGSWRRAPEGKWRLTPDRLNELLVIQAGILTQAAALVAANGWLAYATCSLFMSENRDQIQTFCQKFPEWALHFERVLTPVQGGDGFYVALLQRGQC